MTQVHILAEFFFSAVQGKPIYDGHGKVVGSLRDMAVRWNGASPVVTGIKFAKGIQNHINLEQISQLDESGIKLKGELAEAATNVLAQDEIYVAKWLLDKQIIDLKGSKLVRVNDIKLAWLERSNNRDMVLVAVDIGLRGLARRLGVEFLVKSWDNNFLGWEHIKPLENKTASLRLSTEFDQLSQLHPADIADIVENLDPRERTDLIETLDDETAAEVLTEVDLDTQIEIIESMDNQRASDILEEMSDDEAADILGELSPEKSSQILNLMEPEEANDVRTLMTYAEDTAGAIMTTDYIAFPETLTAEEAIKKLRTLASEAEMIYYIYVVNEQFFLQGVVSLRELIIAQPEATLSSFMHTRVVSILPGDDEQKAFYQVTKYNLLAVPVVDDQGVMLGIITFDDVIDNLVPDRSATDTFSRFTSARKLGKRWMK